MTFVEKPAADQDISHLRIPPNLAANLKGLKPGRGALPRLHGHLHLQHARPLEKALDNDPRRTSAPRSSPPPSAACKSAGLRVRGLLGGHRDHHAASTRPTSASTSINPDFNLYLENTPIYTDRRDLPPSKINSSTITRASPPRASIITNANITNSIVGIRTIIESGATLDGVVCMGADYYETAEEKAPQPQPRACRTSASAAAPSIRKAIIDKNARIGENCRIGVDGLARADGDFGHYYIRDGVIVIPKNAVVPPGSVL